MLLTNGHQVESSQLPNVRTPVVIIRSNSQVWCQLVVVRDTLYVIYQQSPFADSWPLDQMTTDGILSLSDDVILHPEEVKFGFFFM